MLAAIAGGEDGEALVTVLIAVAVRADVRAGSPHVSEARNVGELVEHPGGKENRPRPFRTTRRRHANGAVDHFGVLDLEGHDLDAVGHQLGAAAGTQLRGVQPIVSEHTVHLVGGVVARRAVVEDQDAPARAAEHQRGIETGRSCADDDAVPGRAGRFAVHPLAGAPATMIFPRTRPCVRSRIASGTWSSAITRSTAGVTDPASMRARSASRSVRSGFAMKVPRRWRTKSDSTMAPSWRWMPPVQRPPPSPPTMTSVPSFVRTRRSRCSGRLPPMSRTTS